MATASLRTLSPKTREESIGLTFISVRTEMVATVSMGERRAPNMSDSIKSRSTRRSHLLMP